MKVLDFLERVVFGEIDTDPGRGKQILSRLVSKELGTCPACHLGFRGHYFASVATTIWTEENRHRADAFRNALRNGDFSQVLSFRDFDPHEDALGVDILRCPSRQVVWAASVQPYSLDQRFEILESGVVSSADAEALLNHVNNDAWTDMD